MPARAAAVRPPEPAEGEKGRPRFRRPAEDRVRAAAREVLRGGRRRFSSQGAFRRAVLPLLQEEDPLFVVSGRRLRTLLLGARGVHVVVRYRELPTRRPLSRCPVCWGTLSPIRNETLDGDRVTLGYRCDRCEYWTHLRRRVPVRYSFTGTPRIPARSGV